MSDYSSLVKARLEQFLESARLLDQAIDSEERVRDEKQLVYDSDYPFDDPFDDVIDRIDEWNGTYGRVISR